MRRLYALGVATVFRGDLISSMSLQAGAAGQTRSPTARIFLAYRVSFYTGEANKKYYEVFGVEPARLHYCPHSIDVSRFKQTWRGF